MSDSDDMELRRQSEHEHKAEGCECGMPSLPDHVLCQIIVERDGTVRAARNGLSRRRIIGVLYALAYEYAREEQAETARLEALLNDPTEEDPT